MSNFCVRGEEQIQCKDPIFLEFDDEINIIVIILEYFKQYLPQLLESKKDCYNKPIIIDKKDIGVTIQKDFGDYVLILIPTEDNSSYRDDNFMMEDSEYSFQLQLQVREDDSEGCLENLIKFKSAVKTMLTNMDRNINLNTVIDGFSYDGPFGDPVQNNKFVRLGTYTFSVQDTRFKK